MTTPSVEEFFEFVKAYIEHAELQQVNDKLQAIVAEQSRQQAGPTLSEPASKCESAEYNFSEILDILKSTDADIRVKRTTWGNASVYLVTPGGGAIILEHGNEYYPQPYFTMVSGDTLVAWQPDTEDILADNWIIDDA